MSQQIYPTHQMVQLMLNNCLQNQIITPDQLESKQLHVDQCKLTQLVRSLHCLGHHEYHLLLEQERNHCHAESITEHFNIMHTLVNTVIQYGLLINYLRSFNNSIADCSWAFVLSVYLFARVYVWVNVYTMQLNFINISRCPYVTNIISNVMNGRTSEVDEVIKISWLVTRPDSVN